MFGRSWRQMPVSTSMASRKQTRTRTATPGLQHASSDSRAVTAGLGFGYWPLGAPGLWFGHMARRSIVWVKDDPLGAEFAYVSIGRGRLTATGLAIGSRPTGYRLDYKLETLAGYVTSGLLVVARGRGVAAQAGPEATAQRTVDRPHVRPRPDRPAATRRRHDRGQR